MLATNRKGDEMTPKEYHAMPKGDTKLVTRLAITMGWHADGIELDAGVVWVRETWFEESGMCIPFSPFTDTSIPFGLISRGYINYIHAHQDGLYVVAASGYRWDSFSKTHAIINAYCAADPFEHWARFMKGGE